MEAARPAGTARGRLAAAARAGHRVRASDAADVAYELRRCWGWGRAVPTLPAEPRGPGWPGEPAPRGGRSVVAPGHRVRDADHRRRGLQFLGHQCPAGRSTSAFIRSV